MVSTSRALVAAAVVLGATAIATTYQATREHRLRVELESETEMLRETVKVQAQLIKVLEQQLELINHVPEPFVRPKPPSPTPSTGHPARPPSCAPGDPLCGL